MGVQSGLAAQLAGFREARRELEASVLPLATSVDGRRVPDFHASLYGLLRLMAGDAAAGWLTDRASARPSALDLGQLSPELMLPGPTRTVFPATERRSRSGMRAAKASSSTATSAPFHDVTIRPGQRGGGTRWLERSHGSVAKLRLGELVSLLADVPCLADAGGFNRHTFLCGQSGSGKTYSLGVMLERLLTETGLRLSHPRSELDFVRLGTVRGGTDPVLAGSLPGSRRVQVTVLPRPMPRGERRLQHPRGRARSGDAGGRAPAGPDRGP